MAAASDVADSTSPWAAQVLPHLRRAAAMQDMAEGSRTYGCFDRAFWYYRTLTNFPGGGWQKLALAMALVHAARLPDNPHAGDPALREAAIAGLAWWARIQHRDGSVDEWYLNEHSYCPTAFTVAGAASAMVVLGEDVDAERRDSVMRALERGGRWLAARWNGAVMNQNLAAAAGLAGLAALTGESEWRRALDDKLVRLAREQSAEGWFPEYGGCDLGYSTLALDMLARIDALAGDGQAAVMAGRLAGFLDAFCGDYGPLPGRIGSRGTAHLFPYGAEHFADRFESCARLAGLWRIAHASGAASGPGDVDDRYFAYFYLPQFALAWHRAAAA